MSLPGWLDHLPERIAGFLESLSVPGQVGRYRPAAAGLTPQGERIALGMSCYAHKVAYMLGLWDALLPDEQAAWNAFLRGFQVDGQPYRTWAAHNAFIDPVVADHLRSEMRRQPWPDRLRRATVGHGEATPFDRTLVSETKQAIATLDQVGVAPDRVFLGFPRTPDALRRYLGKLDWTQPWAAGAHAAIVAVFIDTQATKLLPPADVKALKAAVQTFLDAVTDADSGAYFRGTMPDHGTLVNGAMKVLTALDWLGQPIHHPERLIDTTLAQMPRAEGCHLVDAVYVLYRCAQQTDHRRAEIGRYCHAVLAMIAAHFVEQEGSFSYAVGASQTMYYGVPITEGRPVADMHGTILLTWALAMIFALLEQTPGTGSPWRVIRP